MPYETGLCGCMEDMQSCLDVWCCQCCQIGRQYKAVEGEVNQLSVLHCLCGLWGNGAPEANGNCSGFVVWNSV